MKMYIIVSRKRKRNHTEKYRNYAQHLKKKAFLFARKPESWSGRVMIGK